uniref:Uncharacterized protein n=1 Tax=Lutzomyia longipalpis TaxID=7200 RepID=A0A1B0GKN4_LUTLO
LREAATRIQATFRGHLARKLASGGEVKDDDELQEITKKVAEELDIDLSDPELNKAATKIQASFRELREAATRIQATFRGHLARKLASGGEVKDDDELQEITKKVAEELDIDLSDPELNKAATKIQASFRGHKQRKTETDTPNN